MLDFGRVRNYIRPVRSQFDSDEESVDRYIEADFPPQDTLRDQTILADEALLEGPQTNDGWRYPEYGERSVAEPVDPNWAPQMEATIDSLIRSIGSPVRDVKDVECRTTECRAVILFQPSLFSMEEEDREQAVVALLEDFEKAMAPVIETSNRFSETTGIALVQISNEQPTKANIWDTVGAFLNVSGIPLEDSAP